MNGPNLRIHACGCALAVLLSAGASIAQPRVTVDTSVDRGAVRREVFGGDLEFISSNTPEVSRLASELPLLRFPGGDADSIFQWDQALAPRCSRAGLDWPTAAGIASGAGAGVFLETNIVRSSAANAAAWVADAVRRGVRVSWVGIGNEVWGDFDAGFRTAARYATDVRAHATAIRAVAPGARIVLEIGTFNEETWNREAIRRTADVIDAVDYHYYPNHLEYGRTTPQSIMAGADGIAPLLTRVRAMIRAEAPARADRIDVVFGEWDGAVDPPPMSMIDTLVTPRSYASWSMVDGLFYGAALGEMLDGGVAAAMFYEVQGFRFGGIPGNWCLDANLAIRRPKVLVHQLWREHVGERLLATTAAGMPTFRSTGPTNWDGFSGEAPVVRTYASLADSGRSLRLMVVNRGAATTVPTVTFDLRSFDPDPSATVWEVGGGAVTDTNENVGGPTDAVRIRTRAITVSGATFAFAPPPYSFSAIELRRRGSPPPADAGVDAGGGPDATVDAGVDAGRDAATDLGVDAPRPDATAPDAPRADAPAEGGAPSDAAVMASDVGGAVDVSVSDAARADVQAAGCGCGVATSGHAGGYALACLAAVLATRRRRW